MKAPKQTLTSITTKLQPIPKGTIKILQETKDQNLSSQPVRHVVELTTPQRDAILEEMQRIDRFHEIDDRKDRTTASKRMPQTIQMEMSKLQPKL